jgi:hypothetical protein
MRSVVLLDVNVTLLEQLLIFVQLVGQERLSQRLLHGPLTLGGVLPLGTPDLFDNPVDVGD